MRIHPFQVAHDVEQELAHLDAFRSAGTRPSKVYIGGAQFEFAEGFFFAEQPARRAWVLGYENGCGGPGIADQPIHHLTDLGATGL